MTVRIKTQQFSRNGVCMYRVLAIRGALPKNKLDAEYTSSAPSFWLTPSQNSIKLFEGETLSVNGEYKTSVLIKILNRIEDAGNRLHQINKKKHEAAVAAMEAARARARDGRTRAARRSQNGRARQTHDVIMENKIFRI